MVEDHKKDDGKNDARKIDPKTGKPIQLVQIEQDAKRLEAM